MKCHSSNALTGDYPGGMIFPSLWIEEEGVLAGGDYEHVTLRHGFIFFKVSKHIRP